MKFLVFHNAADDSYINTVENFRGAKATGEVVTAYFKSMTRGSGQEGAADSAANLDNNDSVVVTIPNDTHLTAMKAITTAIATGRSFTNSNFFSPLIIVANDDSGGTEYLEGSGITACGTITVQAAYTN